MLCGAATLRTVAMQRAKLCTVAMRHASTLFDTTRDFWKGFNECAYRDLPRPCRSLWRKHTHVKIRHHEDILPDHPPHPLSHALTLSSSSTSLPSSSALLPPCPKSAVRSPPRPQSASPRPHHHPKQCSAQVIFHLFSASWNKNII